MNDTDRLHTGYHSGKNETYDKISKRLAEILNPQFVDDEDDSSEEHNEYSNASVFIQGSCQLFSLALHEEFGFEAYEIHIGGSFHCFCQSNYNGTRVYIDVRGATTDFREFLMGSPLPIGIRHSICIRRQNLEEDKKLSGKFDAEGLAFAKYLIHKNPKYYSIGNP